jgi:Ca-activated chloride channel homolog
VILLDPWLLLLALLVPAALWIRRRRGEPALRFAPAPLLEGLPKTWRTRLLPLPGILGVIASLLVVVALARPVHRAPLPLRTQGIDIMLCLDASSSMNARDLDPARNRLAVAKDAAARFLAGRPQDRVGLVRFARFPDLRCPLTLDHVALGNLLSEVRMVDADGPEDATGIGTAVAAGAKALRNSTARSKVVIVLTDGEENVATAQTPQEIAPVHAAQLCKELGVRVYAIAVGASDKAAPDGRLGVDTSQVRKMTERCDGAFFEARDADALSGVYAEIDRLETVPIEEPQFRIEERFLRFLAAALAALVGGGFVRAALREVTP